MTPDGKVSGRGFTLIEVLIALAIFALASVVLIGAYVNVLNSYAIAGAARDADEDIDFARQQLLKEADVDAATDGGEFDGTKGRHVRWYSEIEPSETIPDLFTVSFTAEVIEADEIVPKVTNESFMLLRPTWSTDAVLRSQLEQDVRNRIAEIQGVDVATLGPGTGGNRGGGGGFGGGRGGNAGGRGQNGGGGGGRGQGGGGGGRGQGGGGQGRGGQIQDGGGGFNGGGGGQRVAPGAGGAGAGAGAGGRQQQGGGGGFSGQAPNAGAGQAGGAQRTGGGQAGGAARGGGGG